jgi:hypothetical protein
MAREKKQKVFTYKNADFLSPGPTLQRALSTALTKLDTIGKRRQSLAPTDESPIWRLVGQFRDDDAFLFGILVQYAPGTNPTFLVDDADAPSISVEQLPAPKTKEGKNREPLEGMLFFACTDNHLVLMQGSALRSVHLEHHLQWLLHLGGGLAGDNTFRLVDQPPKKIRDLLEKREIRQLQIGGELAPPPDKVVADSTPAELQVLTPPSELGGQARQLSVQGDSGAVGVMDAIRAFLGPSELAKLNLDQLAGSNIEYQLLIRYRQSTTQGGHKFMDTLGAALRHAEDVDTKIQLVGGGSIRGNDLRLTGPVRIEHINGVPNPDHVFEEMRVWLLAKLKSGDVQAS